MTTALTDPFGRTINYVRLSVTDRCDLRCFYCLPERFKGFAVPDNWLTFEEISRVIAAFGRLGVNRVRITGGEPLVRKNLPVLAARLAALPHIDDLSLSTNATQLARHAAPLKQAGIQRLNISLDSLRPDRFHQITRGDLNKVMDGLMAAKKVGFDPIKINMVVMKGINDDEVEEMALFCHEHGFTLRFIETMPVGDTGRDASQHYLPLENVRSRLTEKFTLIPEVNGHGAGPARYYRHQNSNASIGFITPMSQHFCETCNRVRLSAEGTLYMCLGQDHQLNLREPLRSGINDSELEDLIIRAIALKPERHEFSSAPGKVIRFMSSTGG